MHTDYDRLIQSVYAGILAPDGWATVLEQLRCLTNAEQATLMVHDLRLDRTTVNDIANPDDSLVRDYEAQYAPSDPIRPVVAAMALGESLVDVFHLGRPVVERGEFHQDFLRAHGLKSVLCAKIYHDTDLLAGLAFQAGVGRDYFGAAELAALQPVLPHLVEATRLRVKVDQLRRAAQFGQRLLDGLTYPVLVLCSHQRLLYTNAAAERWLRTGGSDAIAALNRMARGLARAGTPATAQASLQSGTQRTFLLGFRLPVDHPLQRELRDVQTLIVVRGGLQDAHGAAASFGNLFGLTAAELRVVEALRRDDHLPAAAAALGITHGTARTHLKTVFGKCGCQSQGALRELWAELTTAYIDFDASVGAPAPRQ